MLVEHWWNVTKSLKYACPLSNLPTTNPAMVVLELDSCLHGRKSGTNHLSHDTASE